MSRALSSTLALAACVLMVVAAGGAEGAPRKKKAVQSASRPALVPVGKEQDQFKSCDVTVRDYIQGRRDAAALPVKEIKSDEVRMTLNFVHPYGESGETNPNLAFLRGESIDEKRKILNDTKQRMRALARTAASGGVWYVVSLKRAVSDVDARVTASTNPDNRSSGSAVVLADIDNKCVQVFDFKTVRPESISEELRKLLDE